MSSCGLGDGGALAPYVAQVGERDLEVELFREIASPVVTGLVLQARPECRFLFDLENYFSLNCFRYRTKKGEEFNSPPQLRYTESTLSG